MSEWQHVRQFTYIADDSPRIDKYLSIIDSGWSRSMIQRWLKSGNITVNGQKPKTNTRLTSGDLVSVRPPKPVEWDVRPEAIPLDVVYEDADVLVVNKPRGMVVHPAPGHYSGTLVNALLAHCSDLTRIGDVLRPGIVHRIDKDTSGLLMVAKTADAHTSLTEQLKAQTITRKYVAIVHGDLNNESGTIDAPIGRDERDRQKMAVAHFGKRAVTHFRVLERFGLYTLVELALETGRTHQIRVHMHYIRYPLVGDPKYGPSRTVPIRGQALHAKVLGFDHPQLHKRMTFESSLPDDMQKLIKHLRTKTSFS